MMRAATILAIAFCATSTATPDAVTSSAVSQGDCMNEDDSSQCHMGLAQLRATALHLAQVNPNNRIWNNIDGQLVQVSVSGDGSVIWGVDEGDEIYYRYGVDGSWTKTDGNLKQVSVSGDGSMIWGVARNRDVYYRNGVDGSWTKATGKLNQVSVSGDGSAIWGVTRVGDVYYRNGVDGSWTKIDGETNGKMKQVSVSGDGSVIWGVNEAHEAYYRNGVGGSWTKVPYTPGGEDIKQVSVSGDGKWIWAVNGNEAVEYISDGVDGEWSSTLGALFQVAVSGDGSAVWGVDVYGGVYYKNMALEAPTLTPVSSTAAPTTTPAQDGEGSAEIYGDPHVVSIDARLKQTQQ